MFKKFWDINKEKFLLLLFLVTAFSLRIFNINWDQGQHLHPDERFMTMVSSDIRLPQNIIQYFDTNTSSLNPTNKKYDFYVYGTVPLIVTRFVAQVLNMTDYNNIFIVGRVLSAIFDTLIIFILYKIGKLLKLQKRIIFISLFFYSFAILPIQLSHFFTVDTFTVFFSTLSVYLFLSFLEKRKWWRLALCGLIFGIALASKISIIITLPLFLIYLIIINLKNFRKILLYGSIFLLSIFLSFRIFQPYAFNGVVNFSPTFIKSTSIAHQMVTGEYKYPPNIQWQNTIPIINPLIDIFIFALGPIITLLSFYGFYIAFFKFKSKKKFLALFIILFCDFVFFYQGIQLAKYLRYFYPIFPFLVLFAAIGFNALIKFKKIQLILLILIVLNTLFFINIYLQTNSRISASNWICENFKKGSTITSETWDDSLPLNLNSGCNSINYKSLPLDLYASDKPQKWQKLDQQFKDANYLILSSNRLWASIPNSSQQYPITAQFYKDLFDNKLAFSKIKTFYSYPGLSLPINGCFLIGLKNYPSNQNNSSFFEFDKNCQNPGFYFRDDISQESFTVYDHPQVIIFSRN
ncbi:MAG: glycosyltransferase family 39 protein [Candidatus Shapirobacteria bacterium]